MGLLTVGVYAGGAYLAAKVFGLLNTGAKANKLLYGVKSFSFQKGSSIADFKAIVDLEFRNPGTSAVEIFYLYADLIISDYTFGTITQGSPSNNNSFIKIAPGKSVQRLIVK